MKSFLNRAVVSVAVTVVAVLLAGLAIGQYVWSKHVWAAGKLSDVEPRYARMLGLKAADADLDDRLRQARAALARLGYSAERDAAQIGNDLHQSLRRALQAAGMTVANSQLLPVKTDERVDRISVAAQADGPLRSLQLVLATLQAETPVVAVDSLVVQPTNKMGDDGAPIVTSRLAVTVLRFHS